MNNPETLATIIASLPLAVTALWALSTTGPSARKPLWFIRNRGSAIGAALLLLVIGLLLLSLAMYKLGGCSGGIVHEAECGFISGQAGSLLFNIQFFSVIYLFFIGLPALLCYVVAEIITRIRMK